MTLKAVEYKIKELKREYVKSEYDVDVLFDIWLYEAFLVELVKLYKEEG